MKISTVPKLTPAQFATLRAKTEVTMEQLTTLTDIGRQRISRVEKGHESSLCYDEETKTRFVPRSLTMALLCVQEGIYTV